MIGNISSQMSMSSIFTQNRPSAEKVFNKADGDNSGGLTLEEFAKGHEAKQSNMPAALQGVIPSAEEAFEMLDADGSGEISQAEFEKGIQELAPARPQMSSETSSAMMMMQEISMSMSFSSTSSIEEIIAQLMENAEKHEAKFSGADSDEDGVLSSEEFAELHENRPGGARGGRSADEVFSHIDADGNGEISMEEFMDAPHVKKSMAKELMSMIDLQEIQLSMSTSVQTLSYQVSQNYSTTQSYLDELVA